MFGSLSLGYRIVAGIAFLSAIIAFLSAIFVAGIFLGYKHEHDALVSYRAQVEQMATDQDRVAKAKDAEFERIKKESANDYSNQLTANTAYWSKRLRNFSCTGSVPQASTAASGVNEAAADPLPDYSKLVMDCQASTVQLEQLQRWVTQTRSE